MNYSHLVYFFPFKFMNPQNGFVKCISETVLLIIKECGGIRMNHICKGVIFYLSSFASHCESPLKLVIQHSHYILICGPLRDNTERSTFFK